MSTLGPLVPADETFHHQITDTFATVAQSDHSWTEKVCAMAAPRDGSWQLAFGMGKYPNRNVLDAYAGVSRGTEQWTVRASRRLFPEVERLEAGPIRYEVLEPLRTVRFSLSPNDVLPISFEWTFTGAVPAALEQSEQHRSRDGVRVDADIVRYHHIGTAAGWVDIDGVRRPLDDATSVSTRDHSWGVRYMVGAPVAGVEEAPRPPNVSTTILWSPLLCERPDGSRYGIHVYYQRHAIGGWQRSELQGGLEHPDGRREPFAALVPHAQVRDDNRRLLRAKLDCIMADGAARPIELFALGDTGFHLGTGLYFGFGGHWHGEWRGDLHVDGEHIADCTDPVNARRLHQMRDNLVRVDDPVGGGTGVGNVQSIFAGPHPEIGLTEEASFL
ncbi:MAG TPA: hypothetical protein VMR97_05140 [Acidimicrobiales bacterium]|nr:hypothetical protein [Acidimicrobiales bacterium]